jgi:hypothetical protein
MTRGGGGGAAGKMILQHFEINRMKNKSKRNGGGNNMNKIPPQRLNLLFCLFLLLFLTKLLRVII